MKGLPISWLLKNLSLIKLKKNELYSIIIKIHLTGMTLNVSYENNCFPCSLEIYVQKSLFIPFLGTKEIIDKNLHSKD